MMLISDLLPASDFNNLCMTCYTWWIRTTRFVEWNNWGCEHICSNITTKKELSLNFWPSNLMGRSGEKRTLWTSAYAWGTPENQGLTWHARALIQLSYLIRWFETVIRGRQNAVSNSKQSVVTCLLFNLLLSDENTFPQVRLMSRWC